MTQTIERDAIKRHLDSGDPVVLVEALPEKYFRKAHLPGAIRINPDEVETKVPALLSDKSAKIIVYCANVECRNSGEMAQALRDRGYTDIHEYPGGKADWIDAGLPVEGRA